jgi:hypothetical protein
VFQCSLDPGSSKRLLEIPQWMFDPAIVCLVLFASFPRASCEALQELKGLIDGSHGIVTGAVVKPEHQSLSRTGGSDATRNEVAASKTTAALSSTGHNALLGKSATRSSAPNGGASGAMVPRPHQRRHAGSKPGGAR